MASSSWTKFRVGEPSDNLHWTNPSCQRLAAVSHVAHVPVAVRIVEDGMLRADLVYDKSRLNTERIRVVWLSPNDWTGAGGFRYGNVRFTFDWPLLVEGKRYYWVESIAYGIEACRILVTDSDYDALLERYDPAVGDGPWMLAPGGEHYWNGSYCLEIMVEGDLDLNRATEVDFVTHHAKRCSIDPDACPQRGWSESRGGGAFVGDVVSRRQTLDLPGLTRDVNGVRVITSGAYGAIMMLVGRARRLQPASCRSLLTSDPSAPAVARALLGAVSRGHESDAVDLASMFADTDALVGSVEDVLATALGLPSPKALYELA